MHIHHKTQTKTWTMVLLNGNFPRNHEAERKNRLGNEKYIKTSRGFGSVGLSVSYGFSRFIGALFFSIETFNFISTPVSSNKNSFEQAGRIKPCSL